MNNHFQNIAKYVNSIYVSWMMVISSIINIISYIYTDVYDWKIYLYVFTLILFSPTLYNYHISKSVDVWGYKKK